MNKVIKWIVFFFIGLLIIFIALARPYYAFVTKTLKISPLKALISRDGLITYDDQVNILFLGIAGGNHDGPNLSDTIIVANYNFKTNKLVTISIPRDIWSAALRDKINSAYAYGEAKKDGGGFTLARAEVSRIVGLPIPYAAVIDFDKFKGIIDFLGGIEVKVERSFTDKKFPIEGRENDDCNGDPEYKCRYETISFRKGVTKMNGETALKFVRSRNAEGPEGTDFGREARQQKIINAVKNAMIEKAKKPDLESYNKLYELLNNLIKRNVSNQQLAIMAKSIVLKKNFDLSEITLEEKLFENPEISERYDYKWVLVPASGSYDKIHSLIKCRLENKGEDNHKGCD
jgi:LCP family protein required for cell wall assembly